MLLGAEATERRNNERKRELGKINVEEGDVK